MKFIDEIKIKVHSGDGGHGAVSFRREKFIPKGGPDGGDGGRGGSVIFRASSKKRTLYHLKFKNEFVAKSGKRGQGAKCTGKSGRDLFIDVPVGTLIFDLETGCLLKDLIKEGEVFIVCQGGMGGRGNARFKSSTNRAPRFAQPGQKGTILFLRLELKLLADVGIIGLPNVGKSTLLSVISSAKPKIGNYPFTTLTPNLGIVEFEGVEPFVVADIPGLIDGAHSGFGLGIKFLKHIERTNILIHLVDATQITFKDPLCGIRLIEKELALYSEKLMNKPKLFVLNKIDSPDAVEAIDLLKNNFNDCEFLYISAITGKGIRTLILKLSKILDEF